MGSSSQEIKALREASVPIFADIIDTLEIVYTGDTIFDALLRPEASFIFSAHTLIMELTYLDGDYEKALKWGHIHIDDIVNHSDMFESNSYVIFVHVSQKYSPFSRALSLMRSAMPESLLGKCYANLFSFG